MRESWHLREPESYVRERDAVRDTYPQLHFFAEASVSIRGTFPVLVDAQEVDRFQVEILLPAAYPDECPIVRETGGRIPRISDRHVEKDGRACLFLPEETDLYFSAGSTLLSFLEGPVTSFFIGQTHFEEFGTWPFGERAHGVAGIMEFYAEKLGTADPATIVRYMEYLSRQGVKGHWDCPCGSGERLRKCHVSTFNALQSTVRRKIVATSLERVRGIIGRR